MKKQLLIPSLELSASTTRRYRRELPRSGTVLVKKGDVVESAGIIARTMLPGQLTIVRAAQELGIEPHDLSRFLLVKESDPVEEGVELASYKGFFGLFASRTVSPCTGTIEFISVQTGNIGIRQPEIERNLHAYLCGTIVEVHETKGATIEAKGAFAQGIFGVGGERWGTLKSIPVKPEEIIRRSNIPDNIVGAVLFGGSAATTGALTLAAERGAIGVICGSIDDESLSAYVGHQIGVAVTGNEDVPLTLIISEGFGHIAINPRLLELLKKYEGHKVSINGATQVRAGAVRPEIMIFHNDASSGHREDTEAMIGARVRLIRHPFFGQSGTVHAMPVQAEQIETGAVARVMTVALESGEMVTVPRANAELI